MAARTTTKLLRSRYPCHVEGCGCCLAGARLPSPHSSILERHLTPRESLILAEIVKGHSSKEVARALDISPRTVEFHRANLLKKFGAKNTAELVRKVLS